MRIQNADQLTSHGNIQGRRDMVAILEAGLQAADPYHNTKKLVRREGGMLYVGHPDFEVAGDPRSGVTLYDLDRIDRVFVVGAGKGSQRVGLALEEILGEYLTGGHLIGKHGDAKLCRKIGVTLGGHPTPDEYCAIGCRRILEFARDITQRDLVFTVGANGFSSLLTLPAEGITMEEVEYLTYMMQIEKGVATEELNTIRNHVDQMKGGRFSRHFHPAKMVHIEAIDVTRARAGKRADFTELLKTNIWLHNLCEGSTFTDAVRVLKFWDAWERTPQSIRAHLERARPEDETLKYEEFMKMDFRLFGVMPKDKTVIPAAKQRARELGYTPLTLAEFLRLEAREAGFAISNMAATIEDIHEPVAPPCALISGGELLVTVGDQTGVGGRNQEYALAAALNIANRGILFGAVDTDGTDGPGGVFAEGAPDCLAGGIVDGLTLGEAKERGVEIREALKSHATSAALWALDSGIVAEHSISVGDLGVVLIQASKKIER
jgi:glycerate-2-kinase